MFVLIVLARGLTRVVSTHATFATAVAALDAEPKLEYEALRWLQYVPSSYDAAGVRHDESTCPATPGYTLETRDNGEYSGRLMPVAEPMTPAVFSCTTPRKRARPTLAAAASSTSLDATASATVIDDDDDDE